jgi:hypothetical protein
MVHALAESWRVLKVGGRLIDLRPYSSGWPVEIVDGDARLPAGPVDDSLELDIDVASDQAVLEAVRRGWFEKESKDFFDFTYYWDSVDEMNEFVSHSWRGSAVVPDRVLSEARRLESLAGDDAQTRIRRTLLVASYRKLAEYS